MDKDVWKVIFCQRGDDWYWSLRVMGKQGKVKEKQGNAGKTRKNQGNERKPYCLSDVPVPMTAMMWMTQR